MRSRFATIFLLVLPLFACLPGLLPAQLSKGGLPVSISRSVAPDTLIYQPAETPVPEDLAQEDQKSPLPYRFAVNLPVDLGIDTEGRWTTTAGGEKIWRLNIKSPRALALTLYFDRFRIPDGGKLFLYNPGRTQLLGAFTSANNNSLSTFAAGLIYGDQLTLEYNAPADLPVPDLHISEIGHAYRGVTEYSGMKNGFGGSGPCQVNVNCAEGGNWQNEKRGVVRINVKRGSGSLWCTGSLVNNVRNDGTPYVLTADHCGRLSTETDLNNWIFYFNYEGATCPDPAEEPSLHSMTGATLVAHGGNGGQTGSDFFLVLLKSPVPESFHVYFNGWSLDTLQPSPSGTGIHHPQGDIKKISTYVKPLKPSVWVGGSKLAHWKVNWAQTTNGHGTTEGGSSGSPLFDNQGLLVGTLTGGDSSCDSASLDLPDYYGMFSYSWDKNGTDSVSMLKCWLDPDNSGVKVLNGWALSLPETVDNSRVTIFPNPVTNELNIRSAAAPGEDLSLAVYDIWGRTQLSRAWKSGIGNEIRLDLSGFAPGIYFIALTGGDRRVVRKIVKQ